MKNPVNQPAGAAARFGKRGRKTLIGALVVASLSGAGFMAANAAGFGPGGDRGHGMERGHAHMSMMHSGEHRGEGYRSEGRWHRGDPSSERPGHGMARLDSALDAAGVTEEQRQELRERMVEVHEGMRSEMGAMGENRRAMMELLTAEDIDRDAIEQLRADQIRAMEDASRRMVDALVDAAEILTPEQRVQLQDELGDMFGGQRQHRMR